jgi:hypothetical protein
MPQQRASSLVEAVKEFNDRTGRTDGQNVAGSLLGGLTLLADLLYSRLHEDVERLVGSDSMLMPVSELKARQATKAEIAVYQVAESKVAVGNLGLLGPGDEWYVPWLARLTLGEFGAHAKVTARLTAYLAATPRKRQLAFTNVLVKVLPESSRAPLVLFDLFPLAIHLATAIACVSPGGASDLRHQQLALQPAIGDCQKCRGQILENGLECPVCGNPLWKHEWLVAE